MRLKALHTIQRSKDVIAPGQEFDADTEEAEYLIKAGAAEKVITESKEKSQETVPPAGASGAAASKGHQNPVAAPQGKGKKK